MHHLAQSSASISGQNSGLTPLARGTLHSQAHRYPMMPIDGPPGRIVASRQILSRSVALLHSIPV